MNGCKLFKRKEEEGGYTTKADCCGNCINWDWEAGHCGKEDEL